MFQFPFLHEDLLRVKENNQLVSPIFEHVVHAEYPDSLYFIGRSEVSTLF